MDLAEGLESKQTDSQPVPGVDVYAQSPSWKAGRKMRGSGAKYLEKRSLGEPEYPDEEVGMTAGVFQKAEKLQNLLFLSSSDMSGSTTKVGAPQELLKVEWMNPLNLCWTPDCTECILPQERFFCSFRNAGFLSQMSGTPSHHLTSFPIKHSSLSETALRCSASMFLTACPGGSYFHVCEAAHTPQPVTVPPWEALSSSTWIP